MAWTQFDRLMAFADRIANTDSNSADDYNTAKDAIDELAGNSGASPDKTVQENADDIATLISNPVLPGSYITGLEISVGTDTEHEIDIAVGRCKDSTGAVDLVLTGGLTIDTEVSGDLGLDTGTIASTTWYYIFLIMKDSDSSISALCSLSKTSPTIPAGHTYFRRIRGAFLTNGSANILNFFQKDNYFYFKDTILDYFVGTPGTSALTPSLDTPPDMIGLFSILLVNPDGTACNLYITSVVQTDSAPSNSLRNVSAYAGAGLGTLSTEVLLNSSRQLRLRVDYSSGNVSITIFNKGFIDPAAS